MGGVIGVNAAGDAFPAMLGLQGTEMESVPKNQEVVIFFIAQLSAL